MQKIDSEISINSNEKPPSKPSSSEKGTTGEKKESALTTLKFGHFQLNTSSFWITIVCILCMFLLLCILTNIYLYNKMMGSFLDHEEKLVHMIVDIAPHPKMIPRQPPKSK